MSKVKFCLESSQVSEFYKKRNQGKAIIITSKIIPNNYTKIYNKLLNQL